eukprot:scaffold129_cov254-Pinguiococcus_pyrenoidosus.AAC.8
MSCSPAPSDGLPVGVDRPLHLSRGLLRPQDVSKVDPSFRVVGLVVHRPAEGSDGVREAALVLPNVPEVVVRRRVVRLQADRHLARLGGRVKVAFRQQGGAQVKVRVLVACIQANRGLVRPDGILQTATTNAIRFTEPFHA